MASSRPPQPPLSLRIQGRTVRLVFESPNVNLGPSKEAQGFWCGWTNTISISPDLVPDQKKAVAVHEVVHDIESAAGLTLTEEQVTAFGSMLFAFIVDNPEFIAWLLKG